MSILESNCISPDSRFSLHENPNVAPGICAVCRNSGGDGRVFVDFGLQLDWYGAVYFCSECIRELCEAIGFVPKLSLDIAQEMSKAVSAALQSLQKEYDDFRRASAVVLRDCNCGLSGDIGRGIASVVESSEVVVTKHEPAIEDDRKPNKASGK